MPKFFYSYIITFVVDVRDVIVSVLACYFVQFDLKKHHIALVDCTRLEQKGRS